MIRRAATPPGAGALRRVVALVRKESRQIVRDPSSIVVGIALPVLLILLFGFGLSLDVKDVGVAVVLEDPSPAAVDLAAGFQLSPYFAARMVGSMDEAERLLASREVDGIVRVQEDFGRRVRLSQAPVQLVVHGVDANRARIIQSYAEAAVAQSGGRRAAEGRAVAAPAATVEERIWFNESLDSRHFIVPGLVVIVMTLIGSMLTALVMAREWERGTIEALFVTPVRPWEILLGKMIPNFALGMIGLALSLASAQFLFHVPLRGSILALAAGSTLYLLVTLGIGLSISSAVKSQFVASQITLLVTYLPAMMLSGFLFDLRSMPAAIRAVTYLLPARYFVAILQTVFLAGDAWSVLLPNMAVLALMAAALLFLARRATRKALE